MNDFQQRMHGCMEGMEGMDCPSSQGGRPAVAPRDISIPSLKLFESSLHTPRRDTLTDSQTEGFSKSQPSTITNRDAAEVDSAGGGNGCPSHEVRECLGGSDLYAHLCISFRAGESNFPSTVHAWKE